MPQDPRCDTSTSSEGSTPGKAKPSKVSSTTGKASSTVTAGMDPKAGQTRGVKGQTSHVEVPMDETNIWPVFWVDYWPG